MAFRSGLEEIVADLFVDLGIKYEYECTKLDYTVSHKYCPDFKLPNGIFIEVKGYWDSQDRRKIRNIIKQHPDLDLRMVFQDPNKTISKRVRQHTANTARSWEYVGLNTPKFQSTG